MKLKKNLSIGIFAVVVALIAWILSFSQIDMGLSSADDLHLSPKTFPMLGIIILFGFGSVNIFMSLFLHKEEFITVGKSELKTLWCFLGLLLYLLLFNFFGFIICTTVMGSFILLLEGSKNWKYHLAVFILTVIVFVFFRYGMSVTKLPLGYPLRWFF